MEPELDDRSIVKLVDLASHGDEAVAILNLLDILLSGCLCGYLTQHCLGGCKPRAERREEGERVVRDKRMDGVGRGGCDGLDEEWGRFRKMMEVKYVERKRWKCHITEKKGRQMDRG